VRGFSTYGSTGAWVYSRLIDPLLRALRRRITAICVEQGLTEVIDIACATGAQCRSLYRAGINPVGVDLSPAMIAQARKASPPGIRYVVGSAVVLPFEPGTFPGAILSLCLHEHFPSERERMLSEAYRVVRPGGALIIAEYSRPRRMNLTWGFIYLIERLAGREHFRNFRTFVRAGGIDDLAERLPGIEKRIRLFSGTIGIIVVKRV